VSSIDSALVCQCAAGCVYCVLEGSLFLDGGISVADRVFGEVLFKDTAELLHVWTHLPRHPLQV